MNCSECKYSYMQDEGYSNYTVEGTEFTCLKKKHPDGEFDRFYGEDNRLSYADKCDSFTPGEGLNIDVEREEGGIECYTDDSEIIELYKAL